MPFATFSVVIIVLLDVHCSVTVPLSAVAFVVLRRRCRHPMLPFAIITLSFEA